MTKYRAVLLRVLALLGITWVLVELSFAAYLFFLNGRFVSVKQLLAEEQNTFIRDLKDGRDCTYLDTLYPHPYLAFVHHSNPPCGIPTNNVGLFGPDYPFEKDPGYFTVLLTGGSVAGQLAGSRRPGHRGLSENYLEISLNRRYGPPHGRAFRVLNGGDGAWKQPQQAILLLLHVSAIDAVVTLDGANEHGFLRRATRLELPGNNFGRVNPLTTTGPRGLLSLWLSGRIYRFQQTQWLASRSYAIYGMGKVAREMIRFYSEREAATDEATTVEALFALPKSWSASRKFAWNLERYRDYVETMHAVARQRGVLAAHFIQPVPAVAKRLTAEERRVVGDLGYADSYRQMERGLLGAGRPGIAVHSLLDVFSQVSEAVYADAIHCRTDPLTGESAGYRLMAERMAEALGNDWRLPWK